MKRDKSMMVIMGLIIFILGHLTTYGQKNRSNEITLHRIEATYNKTTNVILPYAIVSVDRGSRDVLAQKAKGAENILQVKAAKEGFLETNLSVVTADGKLTSFIVQYAKEPVQLNVSLISSNRENTISLSPEALNEQEVRKYADYALHSRQRISAIRDTRYDMSLELTGIYIHGDIMYLRMKIQNRSNISYDIEQLRFFVRDQKKADRTASQEVEIIPVYIHNDIQKAEAKSQDIMVLAVPKFTIPDGKFVTVQMMERNGGRHLEIILRNKKVAGAWPLK